MEGRNCETRRHNFKKKIFSCYFSWQEKMKTSESHVKQLVKELNKVTFDEKMIYFTKKMHQLVNDANFEILRLTMIEYLKGNATSSWEHAGPIYEETKTDVDVFIDLNRWGFLTVDSQPFLPNEYDSFDGSEYEFCMKEYVTGYLEINENSFLVLRDFFNLKDVQVTYTLPQSPAISNEKSIVYRRKKDSQSKWEKKSFIDNSNRYHLESYTKGYQYLSKPHRYKSYHNLIDVELFSQKCKNIDLFSRMLDILKKYNKPLAGV